MNINTRLFEEDVWCPNEGIARVTLVGDVNLLPEEIIEYGKAIDGDEFWAGGFSIDIIVEGGEAVGGTINYMAENEMCTCGVCDNFEEAWNFFNKYADEEEMNEVMK